MCGVAGLLCSNKSFSSKTLRFILSNMTDSLYHRGPDDSGIWVDENEGIGLGHRRLSIFDLSPEGRQPMFSQ